MPILFLKLSRIIMPKMLLHDVVVGKRDFQKFRGVIENGLFDDIIRLSKKLRNKRVLYINSNQNRGGVYEHLTSLVPLLRDLHIKIDWKAITEVPADFYEVTKLLYNGIQGIEHNFTLKEWKIYEDFNKRIAKEIEDDPWDFVLVQDHQMLGSSMQMNKKSRIKWIWQSHSETHNPTKSLIKQLQKYLEPYEGIIFYFPEYVIPGLNSRRLTTSSIAIDPLSAKNKTISIDEAKQVVKRFGIDLGRPFITQVSRIDSWKDFPGVVDAWLLAKKQIPQLQLVLIGAVSLNNIHAKAIIELIEKKAMGEKDLHLLVNQVERKDIKAFQTASNIVIQKSLREGFGLTVSEALWSGTPVIGGNVGGIKHQIVNGKCGYLVGSIEECYRRIVELIQNPNKAQEMGQFGREYIRKNFLLPRLMRDELKLMVELMN